MAIVDILKRLERAWATPRSASHGGEATTLRLRCSISHRPAPTVQVHTVPPHVAELWSTTNEARLFEDVDYGQWGLVLLPPDEALAATQELATERARDHVAGDLIVGRFLGDQDLLLVRSDPSAVDFGRVFVVLPLDERDDWDEVAPDLEAFLAKYEQAEGAKYWETQ